MTTASVSADAQRTSAIRVSFATKNILDQILSEANSKEIGSKVKPESVLALALSLIKKEHIEALKNASLTNADRLELRYQEHVKKHGPMTKDDFLGRVLSGELRA